MQLHGLSSAMMALITSDCGMQSLWLRGAREEQRHDRRHGGREAADALSPSLLKRLLQIPTGHRVGG